jgi:AcrR family transcriptional regulator
MPRTPADAAGRRAPAKRTRLTAEERREAILRAAAEVIAARGFAEASVDEIVARAGVTTPVLYDHFPSKKALHLELLNAHSAALIRAVEAGIESAPSPAERFERAIDAVFTYVSSHEFSWRLLFRDAPADPQVAKRHRETQAQTTKTLADLLARDAADALVRDADREQGLEVIAELLKTGINGVVAWWYTHREVPRERLVGLVMDATWIGFERLRRGDRWNGRQPEDE